MTLSSNRKTTAALVLTLVSCLLLSAISFSPTRIATMPSMASMPSTLSTQSRILTHPTKSDPPRITTATSTPISSSTSTTSPTSASSTSLSLAVEGDFDPDAIANSKSQIQSGSLPASLRARLRAFYKFTRPHTIRGTILASIAGTARALIDTPGTLITSNPNPGTTALTSITLAQWKAMLPRAFIGMIALLLGNAFIVGINQIYDKEIDEMNKPFLPVASGEMSGRVAWVVVLGCGIVGPLIVYNFFPTLLFRLYMLGWTLGAIYSVPPFRTKRNPLLAGLTIATVRGFLLNFGVYYAVKDAIGALGTVGPTGAMGAMGKVGAMGAVGKSFEWSPKVSFVARFMTVFATVIAVTKDLPDVEGDKKYNISTFATRIGVPKIAKGATLCLLLNYLHALLTGILSPPGTFHSLPMIGGHAALAVMLLLRFRQLVPEELASIKTYYKHIWDLFYLEYVLYMFI